MWKDLSMQQRADLMDIYLSHGVTSLDEMRRHYDSRDIDTANAYREGGNIHIKPENRGKFTALKKRTGHSATWFKKHGTPAQKKMATFALNARHWKHGLGGNLFDGTSQSSQQMDRPNIFRYNDGRYVYQAAPDAEEIEVSPINTLLPNPSQWTYQDAEGKVYTPHAAQVDTGSITQDEGTNPLLRAANNYMREAAYRAKDGTLALQGKYTMPAIAASALLPLTGEAFAGSTIAGVPATTWANTALTAGFAGHGLNHAINEGINGWGDAAMTALEITPLGRLAKPMYYAGREGLQYAAKVADNTARYVSPSYDLYRTIGETTPRTTPTYRGVRLNGEQAYTGSPLFEFANIQRTSPSESYFFRAPNDIDILKLWNGRFRSKAQGNIVLPSGNVNGKFVSYGEPWQEFDFGEGSALYEFPVGPRRGPSRMATDWRGNKQDFSVDEAYEFMQQEKALSKELRELRNKGTINSEREEREIRKRLIQDKYALVGDTRFSSSINSANQTVIPNERWNFDWFLKTPFWKYSENPISGQVQKELMMRWPEAKVSDIPTIEWAKAVKSPQITAENATSMTPEQWTAAQDAAIARGDMAEAQRLRDLHSKVYGDPIISYHGQMMPDEMYISRRANPYSDVRTSYNASGYFSSSSNPVANTYNFIDGSPTFKLYTHLKNPYIIDAKGGDWRAIGTDRIYRDYVENGKHDGAVIRNVIDIGSRRDRLNGASEIADDIISSPGHSKLADAVTYDDKGVRIPLGERDNFNINDIRYGLLPFGIGLTGYGLWNNKEQE